MATYNTVFSVLTEVVNKSQYFNPFFSWLIVSFTYFSIGIHGGTIWKYLFYTATLGFIATCCGICYTVSQNLDYFYYNFFVALTWVEGVCWTLSEWGYVYINFVKIKSCIKSLRKKHWNIIMMIILVYSIIIRCRLMYLDYTQRIKHMKYPNRKDILNETRYNNQKDLAHGLLFLPLGLVCASFIYFIIVELIEEGDDSTQNILSILLHSTLSRMSLVSLLFIGISIIVHFPSTGVCGFIRSFLWRLKGNLGLIFLVDLLLLRIDLDRNHLAIQGKELEKANIEKSLKGIIPLQETTPLNNNNNRNNSIYNKNTSMYINNNNNNNNNTTTTSTNNNNNNGNFIYHFNNNDNSTMYLDEKMKTIDYANRLFGEYPEVETEKEIAEVENNDDDNTMNTITTSNHTRQSRTYDNLYKITDKYNRSKDGRKGSVPFILSKPADALSVDMSSPVMPRKYSYPNIYNTSAIHSLSPISPTSKVDRRFSSISMNDNRLSNMTLRSSAYNNSFNRLTLSTPSNTSKTAVSSNNSFAKFNPNSSSPDNELYIQTSSLIKDSSKKSPGNILIESNLLLE